MRWHEWYQLPGPAAFLDQIEEDFREGKSVILEMPRLVPPGLVDELSRRLNDRFDWTPIRPGEGSPERQLASIVDLRVDGHPPQVSDLYEESGFAARVFMIEQFDPGQWASWSHFLARFAEVSRLQALQDRSVFLVVANGTQMQDLPSLEILLGHRQYDGVVTALDSLLFANRLHPLGSTMGRLERDLRVSLCSELSLWDLSLCEVLAEQPLRSLLEPSHLLGEYAAKEWGDLPNELTQQQAWELGLMHRYEGKPMYHSAFLSSRGQEGEIRRRMWTAQVKVLFPGVEEERRQIVEHCGSLFSMPHLRPDGTLIKDLADMEIGDISAHLQSSMRANRRLKQHARNLWKIRTELAHCRPVSAPLLLAAKSGWGHVSNR